MTCLQGQEAKFQGHNADATQSRYATS